MRRILSIAAAVVLCSQVVYADSPRAGLDLQRDKMQALKFLVGKWSGPATIHGRNGAQQTTQTEDVQWMLDGTLLTVHGVSRDAGGKVVFEAFATIAYDEADGKYHFRAYNSGHYLDTELKVIDHGFSWAMDMGPHVTISNDMKLTPDDAWQETSTMHMPGRDPMTTVQMHLKHVSQ